MHFLMCSASGVLSIRSDYQRLLFEYKYITAKTYLRKLHMSTDKSPCRVTNIHKVLFVCHVSKTWRIRGLRLYHEILSIFQLGIISSKTSLLLCEGEHPTLAWSWCWCGSTWVEPMWQLTKVTLFDGCWSLILLLSIALLIGKQVVSHNCVFFCPFVFLFAVLLHIIWLTGHHIAAS